MRHRTRPLTVPTVGVERRVVPEDRLPELLERGSRFEAEVLDEPRTCRPVHLEGLRLSVAPVEGEHPQRLEPLPEGVLGGQ